jgi:hypothetical protein
MLFASNDFFGFGRIGALVSNAGVAQLAEQLICNQQVAGSIPIASSNKIKCTFY